MSAIRKIAVNNEQISFYAYSYLENNRKASPRVGGFHFSWLYGSRKKPSHYGFSN